MKRALVVLLVGLSMFSAAAMAHGSGGADESILLESPLTAAAQNAIQAFKTSYESKTGTALGNSLVGFRALKAEAEEVEVGVYNVVGDNLAAKDIYGCHFQYHDGVIEDTHCHDEGEQETFQYVLANPTYSVEEFEAGLVSAADYFEDTKGELSQIEEIKMWQANGFLELSLKWTPANEPLKASYILCHYHGEGMDCHDRSRPGPNEPQD